MSQATDIRRLIYSPTLPVPQDMNMDDSAPRREEMLVMKVGNGITAENVGTIITVKFIESSTPRAFPMPSRSRLPLILL